MKTIHAEGVKYRLPQIQNCSSCGAFRPYYSLELNNFQCEACKIIEGIEGPETPDIFAYICSKCAKPHFRLEQNSTVRCCKGKVKHYEIIDLREADIRRIHWEMTKRYGGELA